MQLGPFGSSGREVPGAGQGTWYLERARKPDAVNALRRRMGPSPVRCR